MQDGTFQESIHFQSPSHSYLGWKAGQKTSGFSCKATWSARRFGPGMERIERQMVALVLWVTAIQNTEGARRKEINILEFGILGHPDFYPFSRMLMFFFFFKFLAADIFWTLCSEGGSGPMTSTQVSWDHYAPGGIALFSLLRPTGAGIGRKGLRQKNLAKWASKWNLDWLVDIDFSMGMIITTLPKKVVKLIALRKS